MAQHTLFDLVTAFNEDAIDRDDGLKDRLTLPVCPEESATT